MTIFSWCTPGSTPFDDEDDDNGDGDGDGDGDDDAGDDDEEYGVVVSPFSVLSVLFPLFSSV
jgi:hypothetical protein